jgi:hypothetical protein
MLNFIAGIGLGSIIAAAIGWRVTILNLTQTSITALRDDLATYVKDLEVMHYTIGNLLSPSQQAPWEELEKQKHEVRVAVLFIRRRILLRLNGTDPLHMKLAEQLKAFDRVGTRVPDQQAVDDLVNLSRRVLKREWEDATWWPLARPIRLVTAWMGR